MQDIVKARVWYHVKQAYMLKRKVNEKGKSSLTLHQHSKSTKYVMPIVEERTMLINEIHKLKNRNWPDLSLTWQENINARSKPHIQTVQNKLQYKHTKQYLKHRTS